MQQNEFGDRETDRFVAHVTRNDSVIVAELVYTSDNDSDQDSGWIVLSPAEANQLGATLIAVAGGYTEGKKASFSAESGSVTHTSIGE